MSNNKQSNLRLVCLASMLKAGRYPNFPRFLAEMRKCANTENFVINHKTFQRDMECLQEEYGAQVAYDYKHKGFYLTDAQWRFNASQLHTSERDAALVSARLAGEMLPAPVGKRIRLAVKKLAGTTRKDKGEHQALLALVASGGRTPIKPEIFDEVFRAWRKQTVLLCRYVSASHQRESEMLLEPHVLAFCEGNWYLKVKLLEKDGIDFREDKDSNVLCLAVHRFQSVRRTGTVFDRDENLVRSSQNGNIFDVPTIAKVRLKLTGKSRIYGGELFLGASLIEHDNESIVLELQKVEEYRIVNFVLCSRGEVKVLSPDSLKSKIVQFAENIGRIHQSAILK